MAEMSRYIKPNLTNPQSLFKTMISIELHPSEVKYRNFIVKNLLALKIYSLMYNAYLF